MRVHITLAPELVERVDKRVGKRRRSGFITNAVARALEDQERWELIESAFGGIADTGHDWDADVAGWVHDQRRRRAADVG
jgi:metal-responsive CopG/Arc/MetJ family transcriptional regulator